MKTITVGKSRYQREAKLGMWYVKFGGPGCFGLGSVSCGVKRREENKKVRWKPEHKLG